MRNKKDISRLLVMALRHDPSILGLQLDSAGYCFKRDVRRVLKEKGYPVSVMELEEIIKNKRFGIDKSGQKIRVDYGNSIGLKLSDMYEYDEMPPEILYHGTSVDALNSIRENGIIRFAKNRKKARDHVFLTENPVVALKKGRRYGCGVAIPILAVKMQEAGFLFYHVKQDIWLIDHIPPEYLDFKNLIFVCQ